jgi:hypothetical protein
MFATETVPVPTIAPIVGGGDTTSTVGSTTNTASPTAYDGSVTTDGLKVTLFGIRSLPATMEYEELTSSYFTKVYNDNTDENTFKIEVKVTDETSVDGGGTRKKKARRLGSSTSEDGERKLQTGVAVEVTYTQTMWYSSDDPTFDPNDNMNLPTIPLSEMGYRLEYVNALKSNSLQGYDELYDVSSITRGDSDLLESGESTKKGLGLGPIIGIVIGSALLLFLLVAGTLNSNNNKKNKVSMVEDNNDGNKAMYDDQPLTTKEMELMDVEQEQPTSFFEEKIIATPVDYDFGAATLGSQTRQASVIDNSFDEMGEYKTFFFCLMYIFVFHMCFTDIL